MKFDKYIVFTPSNFVCLAHTDGQVVLELDVSDKNLGIAPGLGLMIALSTDDARTLADVLCRKADEAEGRQQSSLGLSRSYDTFQGDGINKIEISNYRGYELQILKYPPIWQVCIILTPDIKPVPGYERPCVTAPDRERAILWAQQLIDSLIKDSNS